jgi:IS30 family transposase
LGRSPSGISDEIKRNKIGGRYHSIRASSMSDCMPSPGTGGFGRGPAHQASEARKHNSHKKYVLKTRPTLQSYVVGKLGLGWSPEQIAEDCGKRSTKGYDHRRSTSTMNQWTASGYFPKRTDFRNVAQEQLNDVVHRLNNTPRKVYSITHLARSLVNDCRNFLKRPDAASPLQCSD